MDCRAPALQATFLIRALQLVMRSPNLMTLSSNRSEIIFGRTEKRIGFKTHLNIFPLAVSESAMPF